MVQIITRTIFLTSAAYFTALFLTRLMGRKLVSQMTFFDFVVGVAIGSAIVNLSTTQQSTNLSSFVVLTLIAVFTLILDFGHIKSFALRKLVDSEPVVVVENGKIVDGNMKRIRMSMGELMMKLREKNAFNIGDVEFAIMETDGKISVEKKSQMQPLTPSDLKIPTSYKGLTKDLVIDGKIMQENLSDANLNEQWLLDQLKGHGAQNPEDVFYAGLDTSGNLYVSKRQNAHEKDGKHGIE
ncbi:MAG: YetF domain-containing protein [Bacillota bacterium]